MRHKFKCPLRWSDMDAFGHVNNVQYLRLLEDARVAMFFTESKAHNIMTLDGELLVVRHEIDYLKPLVYQPDPVDIETWTIRIGGAAVTVGYEITADGVMYARAITTLAAIDTQTLRARRFTPDERAWMERWTDTDEATA